MLRLLFFVLVFSMNQVLYAQVIENYQSEILISKSKSIFKKHHSAQLLVDLQNFPESSLYFEIPQGSFVFMDGKLWVYADRDTIFTVALSFLKEKFLPDDPTKVQVDVLNDFDSLEGFHVLKGIFGQKSAKSLDPPSVVFDYEQRNLNDFDDFFIIAIIILLLLIAIFKVVFPNVLGLIIRPQTIISAEVFSESGNIQKFFTLDVLFYVFLMNLGISLFVMLYIHFTEVPVLANWGEKDINNLFFIWFFLSIGLSLSSVVKFLFLKVMVYLFDLSKFDFAHFFYLLRIISVSVLVVLSFSIFFFFNNHPALVNFFEIAARSFFWVYFIGVLFMFLLMVNRVPFKNYHLFAYICTAELIPFLIIVKLIMG